MAKLVEVPQDIIDSIIAAVGDNTRLLKQCTLVSSSFLLPSRKQLFSKITIKNDETCQGIHQFLIQNPVIQSSVGTITLTVEYYKDREWMNGISLPAILRLPFCHLECFSITDYWHRKPWNWDSFSSELKDALSNIIHSSSLKTLSLRGITKFPITFFLHIVHLTTLELFYLSPNDFGNVENSESNSLTSTGVAPMASHTVIDQCVWHLRERDLRGTKSPSSAYFSLIWDIEGFIESIFLPFMCGLRFFEINNNNNNNNNNNHHHRYPYRSPAHFKAQEPF